MRIRRGYLASPAPGLLEGISLTLTESMLSCRYFTTLFSFLSFSWKDSSLSLMPSSLQVALRRYLLVCVVSLQFFQLRTNYPDHDLLLDHSCQKDHMLP